MLWRLTISRCKHCFMEHFTVKWPVCCSSGAARCLEATFLQREGLQGANIGTPEGSLINSPLTSDVLKVGGKQKSNLTAWWQRCDIIIRSNLLLQNGWHTFFQQQVVCDALSECIPTCTFYDTTKKHMGFQLSLPSLSSQSLFDITPSTFQTCLPYNKNFKQTLNNESYVFTTPQIIV